MTLGTTKTATIGRVLNAASTEDGSGFYSVDTTTASFATTLAPATGVGEQLRFKQANGSWAVNPWTLTATATGSLKFLNVAGVSTAVTSLTINSRNVGEVVSEWDGSFWQITQLAALLGGYRVTQALTIVTQNVVPALAAPWNGVGEPFLTIGNTQVPAASVASTTATAASTSNVVAVASTAGVTPGMHATATGVPAGTTVQSVSGLNVTLSNATTVASGAALTFTPGVVFTSGSATVTVDSVALGYNVNPGDSVAADFNS